MLSWMGRTTLEVLGQAGLGYSFDSLSSAEGSANVYSSSVKSLAYATILLCLSESLICAFIAPYSFNCLYCDNSSLN